MYDTLKSELAPQIEKIDRRLKERASLPKKRAPLAGWSIAQKKIIAEARQALATWCASPEGKAYLARLPAQNIEGLQRELDAVLSGPLFERTRELVAAQPKGSNVSLPIKAISLGFAGQIDLGLGVYGSVGYAADINDPMGTSCLYVFGAGSLGVDLGADVAVQAGFWKKSTNDIGGFYWGVEIEIDEGAGIAALGLADDEEGEDIEAVMVDATGGFNDGVDGLLFYAITFPLTRGPVAQEPQQHFLILTNLHCNQIASVSGHDEVYLKFVADGGTTYRYPTWDYYAMSEDQSDPDSNWKVGRSVWFNNSVTVSLWDGNDQIGPSTTFYLSNFGQVGASITNTIYQKPSMSNLWNEIDYTLAAQFVK